MEAYTIGNSIFLGEVLVGAFTFGGDTLVNVFDYRDDAGYVGTMTYSQMVDYFNGYETE